MPTKQLTPEAQAAIDAAGTVTSTTTAAYKREHFATEASCSGEVRWRGASLQQLWTLRHSNGSVESITQEWRNVPVE